MKKIIIFLLVATTFACKKRDAVPESAELAAVVKEFNLKLSTDKDLPITASFKNTSELRAFLQNRADKLAQSANKPFLVDIRSLKKGLTKDFGKPSISHPSGVKGSMSSISNKKSDQIYIDKLFNAGDTFYSVVVNSVYWSSVGFPDMLTVSWTVTSSNNVIDQDMTSAFSYYKPGNYNLSDVSTIPPMTGSDIPIGLAATYEEVYSVGGNTVYNQYELTMYLNYYVGSPDDYAWAMVTYVSY